MKHPALARVFAIVLAILGMLLLITGVRGFTKTKDERGERLAYEKKYAGRIENFAELREELLDSADYNETMTALRHFVDEHEKSASKHKTDTALFSATKGGLKMGEDLIVSIRAQMNEIKEQLHNASSRRAFLESLLSELIASQKSNMPWLDALANQAAQYAMESYMAGTEVTLVSAELRGLMENEPTPASVSAAPYNPPAPPVEMTLPALPEVAGFSPADMEAAYAATATTYLDAAAAYQQAGADFAQQMQDYYETSAQQTMDRLNGMRPGAAVGDAAVSAEYTLAHGLWEDACKTVKEQLDLRVPRGKIQRLSAALTNLVQQANSVSPSFTGETGGIYPGLEELAALAASLSARLDRLGDTDPSELSNVDFLDLTDDLEELFDLLTDAFIVISQNLDNPAAMIAEIMDRLHITEELVKVLDKLLDKAEHEMQAQLEELWYQMGEAEKDAVKLEAEKLGLDKEAALLSKRTLDADTLRDLRSRHAAARQLLVNIPEVKAGMTDDADLADSARAWLDTYARETDRLYKGRTLLNFLAVFGGAMGILGIPAAYELIRSRFLLLAPVLLCMLCAAGAEALNMALGLGQQYAALFTAIFALFQFLIVLPKAKKPRHVPKH